VSNSAVFVDSVDCQYAVIAAYCDVCRQYPHKNRHEAEASMGTISEIKAAVDLVQEFMKYIHKTANHDPQVLAQLEALRGKVLDAYTSEIELRKTVSDLQGQLAMRQLPWDSDLGAYYKETENSKREYFCQKCADADCRLCRLHNQGLGYYCRVCSQYYETSAQRAANHASLQNYNDNLEGKP
jgi:hypothetical protein